MADDLQDPRILRVGLEINGQLVWYGEEFQIAVRGTKYANPLQDECEVKISNLSIERQNFLLTETSPFNDNRTPKRLIVECGRKSYGTTRIFMGDIVQAYPSAPPDIILTIKAQTGAFNKGKLVAKNQPGKRKLSELSKEVARDLGVDVDFQATDKDISSYTYNGSATKQIDKLGEAGAVNVYLDGNVLVVKDVNIPLNGRLRKLSQDTGMIGQPMVNENGVKVKMLADNQTTLGGALEILSQYNPAVNGTYSIYKLGFELTSRDVPFYFEADTIRIKT